MSLDDFYQEIGDFGRYQKLVLFLTFACCWISGAITLFGFFAEMQPKSWTCAGAAALNDEQKCKMWEDGGCRIEYELERDTIVNEWNIICSDKWKSGLPTSIYFIGVAIGSFLFGWIADRFGRRITIIVSVLFSSLASLASSLAPSLSVYLAARLVVGIFGSPMLAITFVLIGELVGMSQREFAQNLVQAVFTLGMVILGMMAMVVNNWRRLGIAVSIPGILFAFVLWSFLPESPRWLLIRKQTDKCEAILMKMAKVNGCSVDRKTVIAACRSGKDVGKDVSKNSKSARLLDIFTHREARKRLLVTAYLWFVSSLVYYGLSMNAKLGSSIYVSFFASAVIELPSLATSSYLLKAKGRKKSTILFAVMTTLFLFIAAFFAQEKPGYGKFLLGASISGKFFIAALFANAYVYTGELAPTEVRSFVLGINSIAARLGGIILPYILMLRDWHVSLPFLIFASVTLLSAATLPFLPETKNKNLPETLDDLQSQNI
eukprot:m.75698 g.75698  ORF g.75698 m.75698 type:complete len:490 (+) comp35949_c0_seq1:2053-3522(+)